VLSVAEVSLFTFPYGRGKERDGSYGRMELWAEKIGCEDERWRRSGRKTRQRNWMDDRDRDMNHR
jgi:hypothetical protein